MAKYRKKPAVVEAIQLNFDNQDEVKKFANGGRTYTTPPFRAVTGIIFGFHPVALFGYWVIKDADGVIAVCKPDIFEKTYEPVADEEYTLPALHKILTPRPGLNVIAVEVPDDAQDIKIFDNGPGMFLTWYDGDDPPHPDHGEYFPPGRYSILCISDSVTETQASNIVDTEEIEGGHFYKDYKTPGLLSLNAVKSFKSWLKANNLEGKRVILKIESQ